MPAYHQDIFQPTETAKDNSIGGKSYVAVMADTCILTICGKVYFIHLYGGVTKSYQGLLKKNTLKSKTNLKNYNRVIAMVKSELKSI